MAAITKQNGTFINMNVFNYFHALNPFLKLGEYIPDLHIYDFAKLCGLVLGKKVSYDISLEYPPQIS